MYHLLHTKPELKTILRNQSTENNMNLLCISILVLGILNANDSLSIFADRIPDATFEVGFDINTFEGGTLRGHPDITHTPSNRHTGSWFRSRGKSSIRYFRPSKTRDNHILEISCAGLPSPYHAFRYVGFTHDQLSQVDARHVSIHGDHDIFEINTSTQHYTVTLSKLEQFLSHEHHGCHWHGYDFVTIGWENDTSSP